MEWTIGWWTSLSHGRPTSVHLGTCRVCSVLICSFCMFLDFGPWNQDFMVACRDNYCLGDCGTHAGNPLGWAFKNRCKFLRRWYTQRFLVLCWQTFSRSNVFQPTTACSARSKPNVMLKKTSVPVVPTVTPRAFTKQAFIQQKLFCTSILELQTQQGRTNA